VSLSETDRYRPDTQRPSDVLGTVISGGLVTETLIFISGRLSSFIFDND